MDCLIKLIFRGAVGLVLFAALGCGVKGDPLPPEKPADIGRGRPTDKRATEQIQIQKNSSRNSPPAKDTSDDDDDERD